MMRRTLPLLSFCLVVLGAAYAPAQEAETMPLDKVRATFQSDLSGLSPVKGWGGRAFDSVMAEIDTTLAFAEAAFARGNTQLGTDALVMARGLTNLANQALLGDALNVQTNRNRIPGRNLKAEDIENIRDMMQNMAASGFRIDVHPTTALDRLQSGGFDIAGMDRRLREYNISANRAIAAVASDTEGFQAIARSLENMVASSSWRADVAGNLGQLLMELGPTLREVTDTIKGLDTDKFVHEFDRISRDLGFKDFRDLINAINEAYGLNLDPNALKDRYPSN